MEEFLKEIKTILDHQKEIRKIKGEDFNIFTITRKTADEQFTHSAFLAELLNPQGSHLMGDKFLKLFLNILGKELSKESASNLNNKFNAFYKTKNNLNSKLLEKTDVFVEKHIGEIQPKPQFEGDLNAKGGYIDVLLKLNNNYITIENKIYAPDQINQVIRYVNFEYDNNIVFYLTLNGKEPHKKSKGSLESGINYYCISYKAHIAEWLNKCYIDSTSQPILRETIRQYIILINKLTGQMENSEELINAIFKNFETSREIYNNFTDAIDFFRKSFRNEVSVALEENLKDYEIELFEKSGELMIHIKAENLLKPDVFFGIATFSDNNYLNVGSSLIVGIRNNNGDEKTGIDIISDSKNQYWPIYEKLYDLTNEHLAELFNNDILRDEKIKLIVEKTVEFINKYKDKVIVSN